MKDPAIVSFCVFMGGDWKTTEREKIQIARNIAWGRVIKKEETKYWNHIWCLTKWMKSNFAL